MAERDITVLGEFSLPSVPGSERLVANRVAETLEPLGLAGARLERLKTAVAEAAMNAIEHGNGADPSLPVLVSVEYTTTAITVRITDQGGGGAIPLAETPDLEAKLAGEQKPRGWGLFLIESMVDEVRTRTDGHHHVVELVMRRGNVSRTAFEASLRVVGSMTVIDLTGLLDRSAERRLDDVFNAALVTRGGPIVLNFSNVGYINSTGIALVVVSLRTARSAGRAVRAFGLSDHYREIFAITRLSEFMEIFDDEPAALAARGEASNA